MTPSRRDQLQAAKLAGLMLLANHYDGKCPWKYDEAWERIRTNSRHIAGTHGHGHYFRIAYTARTLYASLKRSEPR